MDVLYFEPFDDGKECTVREGPCMVGYLKLDATCAHPAHYVSERLVQLVVSYNDGDTRRKRHLNYAFDAVGRIKLYPK